MSENMLNDPSGNWLIVKLASVIVVLSTTLFGYTNKRISSLGKRIDKVDESRQKKCVVKEQCVTNRDYQNQLLDKICEGQDRIETAMTNGFEVINKRVDDLYKTPTEHGRDD